jgi:hypothetical protein
MTSGRTCPLVVFTYVSLYSDAVYVPRSEHAESETKLRGEDEDRDADERASCDPTPKVGPI